ncbi:MAG: hypothetical protein KDB25_07155 [Leucobacter sp.]|nr:hypothetical protein [Leucobacter sp.]
MSAVFIAVDSGGTRTNVEVSAPGTDFETRRFEVADSLSGVLPPSEYAATIRRIFAPIENYWQEHDVPDMPVYAFFGAAGFAEPTRGAFLETLHDALADYLNSNIRAAGACNDTAALLWGHRANGAIVAGTGSNVLVRTADGAVHQAGGHDWVASDYGSGFWVALNAIRQVARDFEAGENTVLLNRFREVYGIFGNRDEEIIARFRALAVSDNQLKADIARFAAGVCAAAELGDLSAQNIVKGEAEDLADSVARVVRRRFSTEDLASGLTLVQCGSLLGNDFYRAAFESQVRMRLSSGTEADAITWFRTKNGIEAAMNLAQRLAEDTSELMEAPIPYRPAIVRF